MKKTDLVERQKAIEAAMRSWPYESDRMTALRQPVGLPIDPFPDISQN